MPLYIAGREGFVCLRPLDQWTLLYIALHVFFRIEVGRMYLKRVLASICSYLREVDDEHALSVEEVYACLFRHQLGCQDSRRVRLPNTGKLVCIRIGVEGDLEQAVVNYNELLSVLRIEKGPRHIVMDARALDLKGVFVRSPFCSIDYFDEALVCVRARIPG